VPWVVIYKAFVGHQVWVEIYIAFVVLLVFVCFLCLPLDHIVMDK